MRVYLDDERTPPEGWVLVRWPEEAIALLLQGGVEEISLDHDLGDDRRGTGYDVVLWIERAVAERGFVPPRMRVHSANTSARLKMEADIAAIGRLLHARKNQSRASSHDHEPADTAANGGALGPRRRVVLRVRRELGGCLLPVAHPRRCRRLLRQFVRSNQWTSTSSKVTCSTRTST